MDNLVSIVIPVYNVEDYLDRCVQSVVNQTYKNLEIILVDDGSPDNCPAMCDEWAKKDSRIRVVHKKNAGLGLARNSGLEVAKGKYIFFFDSDDYVDVSLVEKCVAKAESDDCDVVIYGRKNVNDDGVISDKPLNVSTTLFTGNAVQNELLPSMFTYSMGFGVSVWGKMYVRDLFFDCDIKFVSEREIVSEDAYFALELYSKNIVVGVVNENLYCYYVRSNSLSRTYKPDRQLRNDEFLKKSMQCIDELGLSKTVENNLKVRYHFFTLATIKQISQSKLSKKEKKDAMRGVFESKIFRDTLTSEVLALENPSLRVFFYSIKFKCYFIAQLLLKIKLAKGS